jgi:hypothetical protein
MVPSKFSRQTGSAGTDVRLRSELTKNSFPNRDKEMCVDSLKRNMLKGSYGHESSQEDLYFFNREQELIQKTRKRHLELIQGGLSSSANASNTSSEAQVDPGEREAA